MARQGDLFSAADHGLAAAPTGTAAPLLKHQLIAWQQRLAAHQGPLFAGNAASAHQPNLLERAAEVTTINPLQLQRQPLSFWRWSEPPVRGPALYFVIDRPLELDNPLLLYIGETARAEQRWKAEHDCKAYLAAYGDAVHKAGLSSQLSISFCSDVPSQTKGRRGLEQALIRLWLPPFNKETRGRWATPFHADGA